MYLDGLDRIDQQIIDLLTHHARMSYVEIGQKVGLSRVAVKTRIQSMEEKGIIEEYNHHQPAENHQLHFLLF